MLLLGHPGCIPDIKDLVVYNLSSLLEGYQRVDILPPVTQIDYINELDFDIAYANYIIGNNDIFYEFFSKIIYPLYNGYNVYLITTRNIFYDKISDSLMKFIQQRYEYLSAILNEPEDVDYINPDIGFGINGVYNLDMDKERFTQMYVYKNTDPTTGRVMGFE